MATIQELYIQSLLAQAAYANLQIGIPQQSSLRQDANMSVTQAAEFASQWRVVNQLNDASVTGVSATLFEEIATGKKYLAVRGTEFTNVPDLLADYVLSNGFPSTMNLQYQKLKQTIDTWTANGTIPINFTVTGHSLGGYLASALAIDYGSRISATYTYNAPGVDGIFSPIVNVLRSALGVSGNAPLANLINVRGTAGWSAIAGVGNQLSPPLMVETETNINPVLHHSIVNLTDSLSLLNVFAQLDATLSVDAGNKIIAAASNQESAERERALDAIRKIIQGSTSIPTQIDNRENYYQNLQDLQNSSTFKALAGKLQITATTANAESAKSDFGQFLSLYYLTPFTVSTPDAG
ncbi:lipase family protein, partial [Parvibium lacunae]